MRKKSTTIATSLSRFSWVLAIAACDDSSTDEGTIPCELYFCTSGQVCISMDRPPDAGIPSPLHRCETVPERCELTDCAGASCPACLRDLCRPGESGVGVTVTGRSIICPP
jgi:hypothetical protein